MKIKLNSNHKEHDKIVKRLSEELPELTIRSKERTWGEDKPSFKYRKKLYEFDTLEEFINQAKKILKLTDKDYNKKTKAKVRDIDPKEMGEIREVEELLLEIPVEKYNLNDLNIKLRLGSHSEKSSSYETSEQTLHFEVLEMEEPTDLDEEEENNLDSEGISMTSVNNDIILDIPSEKFSLNDLNLNIKFTQYGEANSTYEVKNPEKEVRKTEEKTKPVEDQVSLNEASEQDEKPKTEEVKKKAPAKKAAAPKKASPPGKPAGTKRATVKAKPKTDKDASASDNTQDGGLEKTE